MEDLSLRYSADLPRVIKNATFVIKPFSKVGIVGRTGAGKSTIATAFFRLLEADGGRILIDGIDIAKMGLRDLRRGLTIIPQDPTLFAGTIRSNLDPFGIYTDEQMFEALRRVSLIEEGEQPTEDGLNPNVFLNLSSIVAEGGGNLSQGQRQLMCLARSLLKAPKVILMDEATASVDHKTDNKIQQTMRTEFTSSTCLTIAHRIRSIIDYDMILVLDNGEVKEYDPPYVLLQNSQSLFRDMCESSGEFEALKTMAKQAYEGHEPVLVELQS